MSALAAPYVAFAKTQEFKMAKSSGGGRRTESPPPRTSSRVEHKAGQKLSSGNKTERSLAGSVLRHIEPRKTPK